MVYKYRVTLAGLKGFYRVYEMSGDTTLYAFHKQMRADLEFPQDQLILFKGLHADGGAIARYGLFDLGNGTVDVITLAETVKAGIASFLYYYDVPDKKSVIVTFEGTEDRPGGHPVVVDTKGPAPIEFENGYVAFEDLPDSQRHLPGQKPDWGPDDDDDVGGSDEDLDEDEEDKDEEEEEDDDEDGKEVFDGTEDLNP